MIEQELRAAIFPLRAKGKGTRKIARALGLSRNTVREILRSGRVAVPCRESADRTEPHADLVRELYQRCEGNRVRVAEELAALQIAIPYSTLTAGLRWAPKERAPVREEIAPLEAPSTERARGSEEAFGATALRRCGNGV
jgi:predicted transcriptional regulator